MKNINLKFDVKSIVAVLLKKLTIVLWVLLGMVLLAEAWIIKDSVDKILTASDQSQFSGAQLVRVNFTSYDKIEKNQIENQQFLPPEPTTADPFGLKPQ